MNKLGFSLLFAATVCVGCSSVPEESLWLAEVRQVQTPDLVATGNVGEPTKWENLGEGLHKSGYTDDEIARGQVAVVRDAIYWNNTSSRIFHNHIFFALAPLEMKIEAGNVIEVFVGRTQPYTIRRIRAKNIQEGNCDYNRLPTDVVRGLSGLIGLVGPSGLAPLYCKGIENEGWKNEGGPYFYVPPPTASESTK